jgi:DNA repair protein RecO (recombination protein O)
MPTERVYRTHAVVLRRHNTGEADRVLTLFTPTHGKIRAVARGVRRIKSRLAGHVELFSRVDVLLARGRSLDIVTQAEVRDSFLSLRGDLWKAAYASYVNLNVATGPAAQLAARAAELLILGAVGYAPELHVCIRCVERLQPVENSISAGAGGTLCPRCARTDASARPLSVRAIKAMRLLRTEGFEVASRLHLADDDVRAIELALRAHLAVTLERSLRSTDALDRLRAASPTVP